MTISSHRIRTQEKRIMRKLIWTLGLIFAVVLVALYGGLPLLARTIVALSSLRKDKTAVNTTEASFLFPPTLNPIDEATNSAKTVLSGFTEKEATVKIFVNDKETFKVTADKEGKFTASNIKLTEGENTITARLVKDDKLSDPSSPLTIVYKKTPPQLEISSPKNGEKIISDNRETAIKGETDPGNKITINDRFVIIDQYGKFSYPVSLSEGENNFKIKAIDAAGNLTEEEIKVTYSP